MKNDLICWVFKCTKYVYWGNRLAIGYQTDHGPILEGENFYEMHI